MKICLVHEEYPEETNFGGIATYQKRLAEEYVRQGHSVYVIARGLSCDKHYKENGVDITRIYVNPTGNQVNDYVEYRTRVAKALKKLQDKHLIDIIEVPDWGAETVLFEEYRKIPLVVRLHTPLKVWLKFNKNNFGEVTNQMLDWEDKMLKSANLVTCCSEILKTMIVEDFNISPENILVTPNPADLKWFFKDESIKKLDQILYVGSLEERKGVCVLAHALNIFFKSFPNVKINLIGKDTVRNNKNISTVEYIKEIVDKKYQDNLNFLGQKKNYELNQYYNENRVAIFPSLFDNFPYVVLEAMASGIQVVGSRNSGMVEMLADGCVYNTPDHQDLARLMIQKYQESLTTPYNQANIDRVNSLYNAKTVCENMIKLYEASISDYKNYYVNNNDIIAVLKKSGISDEVKGITRQPIGVANAVFKVETTKNTYIIKKYNYKVKFKLAEKLYDKYNQANIHCVSPLNKTAIKHNGKIFNIYNFIEGTCPNDNLIDYLKSFILVDRKTNLKNRITKKCDFYYKSLKKNCHKTILDETSFVIKTYEEIKNNPIFKECFINHGDISKTNLIYNQNGLYVIDFDETTIAPMLYDFAVVSVKFFIENEQLNKTLYDELIAEITKNTNYTKDDCNLVVKYYLCKILLEKFYLHTSNEIDIFSKEQQRDNFKVYYEILKSLN